MTIAEIHGKISRSGENLSERLEDLLTSDTFGCMRYIPPQKVLLPFLQTARTLSGDSLQLNFQVSKCHFAFWPWLESPGCIACEPDVLIGLVEKAQAIHIVGIEAKYYSGKSSAEDEEDEREPPNDQLARELDNLEGISLDTLGWKPKMPVLSRSLVFVTPDMAMPRSDMIESLGAYNKKPHRNGVIFWTSWRLLPGIVQKALRVETVPEYLAVMEDMHNLLLRKGLTMFEGLDRISASFALEDFCFYRSRSPDYVWPDISDYSDVLKYVYEGATDGQQDR